MEDTSVNAGDKHKVKQICLRFLKVFYRLPHSAEGKCNLPFFSFLLFVSGPMHRVYSRSLFQRTQFTFCFRRHTGEFRVSSAAAGVGFSSVRAQSLTPRSHGRKTGPQGQGGSNAARTNRSTQREVTRARPQQRRHQSASCAVKKDGRDGKISAPQGRAVTNSRILKRPFFFRCSNHLIVPHRKEQEQRARGESAEIRNSNACIP